MNFAASTKYSAVCSVALVVLIGVTASGCATILGHNQHLLDVTSEPAGANVYLNGEPMGQTPVTVVIRSLSSQNIIRIRRPGFDDERERVSRKIQTVAFCNLLNLICWGIDYLSDSMFELNAKRIHFDLRPRRAMRDATQDVASRLRQPALREEEPPTEPRARAPADKEPGDDGPSPVTTGG